MLAKRVGELPADGDWIFEPKWDGFRALIFRDGDEILIQSRDEKPLNRYFPELIEPLRSQLPARCVLDGEIVIVKDSGLDFDALQLRLHPAASRVKLLSAANSGIDRVLRSAVRGRPRSARRAVSKPPQRAGIAAFIGAHRPFTSRRRRAIERRRRTGSAASKARVSTASWPSRLRELTSPTSASCSRSSTSAIAIASSPAFAGTRKASARGRLTAARAVR